MKIKNILLGSAATFLLFSSTSCLKPEIAIVLEDYCEFQKACDYSKVDTANQFHDLKSCDKFHKDLLNNAADGSAKGCKSDVEDFFIDLMNAQMDQPNTCSETLMESLNRDKTSQQQLKQMMQCMKENGSGDTTAALSTTSYIIGELQMDLHIMDPEVCNSLIATFIGDENQSLLPIICNEGVLKAMTPETCTSTMTSPLVQSKVNFTDEQVAMICNMFRTYE